MACSDSKDHGSLCFKALVVLEKGIFMDMSNSVTLLFVSMTFVMIGLFAIYGGIALVIGLKDYFKDHKKAKKKKNE